MFFLVHMLLLGVQHVTHKVSHRHVVRTRSPWVRTKHLPAQGSTWLHLVLGFEVSGGPPTGHHFKFVWIALGFGI